MRIVPVEKAVVQHGQRFGRWTVIGSVFRCCYGDCRKSKQYAVFECDCGTVVASFVSNMTRGLSQSCGCQRDEVTSQRNWKHGESHTRLHVIWRNIIQRCEDKNCQAYKRWYGGRGITICKEWRESFVVFRDWALSNGYESHLTIDRRDGNGHYCPENCRWVTQAEQNKNKRPRSEWALTN